MAQCVDCSLFGLGWAHTLAFGREEVDVELIDARYRSITSHAVSCVLCRIPSCVDTHTGSRVSRPVGFLAVRCTV